MILKQQPDSAGASRVRLHTHCILTPLVAILKVTCILSQGSPPKWSDIEQLMLVQGSLQGGRIIDTLWYLEVVV